MTQQELLDKMKKEVDRIYEVREKEKDKAVKTYLFGHMSGMLYAIDQMQSQVTFK